MHSKNKSFKDKTLYMTWTNINGIFVYMYSLVTIAMHAKDKLCANYIHSFACNDVSIQNTIVISLILCTNEFPFTNLLLGDKNCHQPGLYSDPASIRINTVHTRDNDNINLQSELRQKRALQFTACTSFLDFLCKLLKNNLRITGHVWMYVD